MINDAIRKLEREFEYIVVQIMNHYGCDRPSAIQRMKDVSSLAERSKDSFKLLIDCYLSILWAYDHERALNALSDLVKWRDTSERTLGDRSALPNPPTASWRPKPNKLTVDDLRPALERMKR